MARKLKNLKLPNNVEIFEIGVTGIDIIPLLEEYEKIIIIDAVRFGSKPGTVYKMRINELIRKLEECTFEEKSIISLHDIGGAELLYILVKLLPELSRRDIMLVGVEISKPRVFSEMLSLEVRRSVDKIIKIVLEEIRR